MAKRHLSDSPIQPWTTLAGQAADHLRREILTRFKPGDPLPPERQLGPLLGVSRNTIRKAVEQLRSEGWLVGPRGAPPRVARPPAHAVQTSGLLVPMEALHLFQTRFYRDISSALHEVAVQNKRSVLYLFSLAGERGGNLLSAMMGLPNIRMVDSLFTLEMFDQAVLAELALLAPVIALDVECRAAGVSSLYFDHQASMQMAVKYLYDLGHRRIAIMIRPPGDPDPAVELRFGGFVQAMQRVGLSATAELVYRARLADISRVVDRIASLPTDRRPTAIVALDVAWELAYLLARRGLRVPQDLSVMTIGRLETWLDRLATLFDEDIPSHSVVPDEMLRSLTSLPAEAMALALTTVELPARRMGRLAMTELLRRLKQPDSECTHQMLDVRLRPGNSTAAHLR